MILRLRESCVAYVVTCFCALTSLNSALASGTPTPRVSKQNASSHSAPEVVSGYTVRIEKVKNTTKYAPYKGPVVEHSSSNETQRVRVPASGTQVNANSGAATTSAHDSGPRVFTPLQGKVDDISIQSDFSASVGIDGAADEILSTAKRLPSGKIANVSDKQYKEYVRLHCPNLSGKASELSSSILVIKGKWDHAEHLLEQAGIEFSETSSGSVASHIKGARVALLNCPADLSDSDMFALRKFVDDGGYLLSTDWALDGSVARMFPTYLVWKGAYSAHQTVDAITVAPADPLVHDFDTTSPWHLDDKCEIVELAGGSPVTVLVRSRQLSNADPSRKGILAATFQYGKGKVLHLVGHFDNNTVGVSRRLLPDPSSKIQISLRQAITLNFLSEALSKNRP